MAQPLAQESPAPLPRAPLDAPLLPAAPSTSAAAYARPPRQKQSALPARQESARTRRALLRCPISKGHIQEIRRARSRQPPQIFPLASNASAPDPLATASCRDPQVIRSTRASPIPTRSPRSSPPTSCNRQALGLPLPRQPAPRLAT